MDETRPRRAFTMPEESTIAVLFLGAHATPRPLVCVGARFVTAIAEIAGRNGPLPLMSTYSEGVKSRPFRQNGALSKSMSRSSADLRQAREPGSTRTRRREARSSVCRRAGQGLTFVRLGCRPCTKIWRRIAIDRHRRNPHLFPRSRTPHPGRCPHAISTFAFRRIKPQPGSRPPPAAGASPTTPMPLCRDASSPTTTASNRGMARLRDPRRRLTLVL